ncbi:MAG: hypothetical protein JWP01_1963 [Myxococcales bacterium]|nr:hypothetical protein [Myxococcales bacterium]
MTRSTESYGLGQSGYTAGRREGDPALDRTVDARNCGASPLIEERLHDLWEDDERWLGRGCLLWYPAQNNEPKLDEPADEQNNDERQRLQGHSAAPT